MDPSLKSFAVFINSATSVNKTTSKSVVQIPFTGNFASCDATKVLQVALSQFKFTNSLYNINEFNNTLKVAVEFAPGRGYTAVRTDKQWETWTLRVPIGTYNIDQMATILSLPGSLYPEAIGNDVFLNKVGYESISQQFAYPAIPIFEGNPTDPPYAATNTFADCFVGFGAIPADPTDPIITPGVVTVDNNSRTVFRSADLGHLIQYGTDITTPCSNILAPGALPTNSSLDFSFVYKGVYLVFDEETAGLLKVLGYFNIDRIPAPLIPNYRNSQGVLDPNARGYGFALEAKTVYKPWPEYDENGDILDTAFNPATMRYAYENTTYYTFTSVTAYGSQKILQVPTFAAPVGFSGYFPGTQIGQTTVEMLALYELSSTPDKWTTDEIVPGMYISGSGVGVPSPYITNRIEQSTINIVTPALGIMAAPYNTENCFYIEKALYEANNGFGLQIGSGITCYTIVEYPFFVDIAFNNQIIGVYVLEYDAVSVVIAGAIQGYRFRCSGVVGTINDGYTADTEYLAKSVTYTLNIPQTITNTDADMTAWVATLVSLNDRTARLVPNLLTNLEGTGEIHIHIPQLRTQYYSSINFQALQPSDVIAVVPIDSAFGGAQTYQPPVTLNAYLHNTNIVTLNIELTDAAGRPLDFNGLDWSMVLKCEEMDVMSNTTMNAQGTMNTIYQDEMANLESTAQSQVRLQRHHGKRMLPHQFFENNEQHLKSNKL
jgi:hypothetical protein